MVVVCSKEMQQLIAQESVFAALQLMMISWFSVLVVAMDDAILYDGMALALIRCKPDALKPDKCAQDTLILPKDSLVEIEITPL